MSGSKRMEIIACAVALVSVAVLCFVLEGAAAPPTNPAEPVKFTEDGKLMKPDGYRKWVYVGTPVIPNDLNDGEAPFPEFHAVYIDPESFPLSDVPLQAIAADIAARRYNTKPSRVFPFQEIQEAHRVMEAGQAGGKMVVVHD